MEDTLDDVSIPTGQWLDLYAQIGVPVGTPLYGFNKSSYRFLVQVQELQPR